MELRLRDEQTAVWTVELGAPDATSNSLTARAVAEFLDLLRRAVADDTCRVIVLRSAANTFCTGLDLESLLTESQEAARAGADAFRASLALLCGGGKVTVALVDGAARGGGVGMVAACDLVLATPRASFGLPELTLGLIPAMVYPVLRRRLSRAHARLLMLSPEVDLATAQRLGLVDQVCEDGAALDRASARWLRHVLRVSPAALAAMNALVGRVEGSPIAAALDEATQASTALLLAPAQQTELRALLAGDLPSWFATLKKMH